MKLNEIKKDKTEQLRQIMLKYFTKPGELEEKMVEEAAKWLNCSSDKILWLPDDEYEEENIYTRGIYIFQKYLKTLSKSINGLKYEIHKNVGDYKEMDVFVYEYDGLKWVWLNENAYISYFVCKDDLI